MLQFIFDDKSKSLQQQHQMTSSSYKGKSSHKVTDEGLHTDQKTHNMIIQSLNHIIIKTQGMTWI